MDARTSPQALAEALTARLKPLDRHFRVHVLRPGEREALAQRRPPPDADPANGITRVDVLAGRICVPGLRGFAGFAFRPEAPRVGHARVRTCKFRRSRDLQKHNNLNT